MGEVDNIHGFERERSVLVERLNQPVFNSQSLRFRKGASKSGQASFSSSQRLPSATWRLLADQRPNYAQIEWERFQSLKGSIQCGCENSIWKSARIRGDYDSTELCEIAGWLDGSQ